MNMYLCIYQVYGFFGIFFVQVSQANLYLILFLYKESNLTSTICKSVLSIIACFR